MAVFLNIWFSGIFKYTYTHIVYEIPFVRQYKRINHVRWPVLKIFKYEKFK